SRRDVAEQTRAALSARGALHAAAERIALLARHAASSLGADEALFGVGRTASAVSAGAVDEAARALHRARDTDVVDEIAPLVLLAECIAVAAEVRDALVHLEIAELARRTLAPPDA